MSIRTIPSIFRNIPVIRAESENSENSEVAVELPAPTTNKSENVSLTEKSGLRLSSILANLSVEQRSVVESVLSGRSLFFTGCAGTGKSFTLKSLTAAIRATTGSAQGIFFTAMTGVAASLLPGATTLHTFAGIGQGEGNLDLLVGRVKRNKLALRNWGSARILVIDEVSMLSRRLFEVLDRVGRNIRKNDSPFGGIQLVLCGDFFQLPPVSKDFKNARTPTPAEIELANLDKQMCFESPIWNSVIKEHIVLRKVFRQQDLGLVNLLNEVRFNSISEKNIKLLKSLCRPLVCPPGITPTILTPFNAKADTINQGRLDALPEKPVSTHQQTYQQTYQQTNQQIETKEEGGDPLYYGKYTYTARDSGADEFMRQNIDKLTCYPKVLTLKVGAQVMMLKNNSALSLVNGSCGVVEGFRLSESVDRDKVEVLESVKCPGNSMLPVVRFANGVVATIGIEAFTVEDAVNPSLPPRAKRDQIPLRLAWAVTIHKAQGMTIDYLQVDVRNVFEAGQAYVALSRARSVEGLQVLSFDEKKFWCDPKVVNFYKTTVDAQNRSDAMINSSPQLKRTRCD